MAHLPEIFPPVGNSSKARLQLDTLLPGEMPFAEDLCLCTCSSLFQAG